MEDRLISGIYEAALEPERWDEVLQEVSRSFGGATVYLCQENVHRFGTGNIWTYGFDRTTWSRADAEYWTPGVNPAVASVVAAPVGRSFDRRQFFDDEAYQRDPMAREVMLSQGIFHVVLASLHRESDLVSAFWLGRHRSLAPFDDAERRDFDKLAVHLGRAMRTHQALACAACVTRGFQSALDRLKRGVALVDQELRIAYANPAMERMLDDRRGLGRSLGRLRLSAPRAQSELEAAARSLTHLVDWQDATVDVADHFGELCYRLVLSPALGDATSALAPWARLIIFASDERRARRDPPSECLERDLALTPAEARVAALAARAMRPAEMAEALGLSENTVKSQLKSIYDKLGVRSLAGLVRAVLTRTH